MRKLYFFRCEKCNKLIRRSEEYKECNKDHYFNGKFCSNTRWKPVVYVEVEQEADVKSHTSLQGVEPDNLSKKPCKAKRGNLALHISTQEAECKDSALKQAHDKITDLAPLIGAVTVTAAAMRVLGTHDLRNQKSKRLKRR